MRFQGPSERVAKARSSLKKKNNTLPPDPLDLADEPELLTNDPELRIGDRTKLGRQPLIDSRAVPPLSGVAAIGTTETATTNIELATDALGKDKSSLSSSSIEQRPDPKVKFKESNTIKGDADTNSNNTNDHRSNSRKATSEAPSHQTTKSLTLFPCLNNSASRSNNSGATASDIVATMAEDSRTAEGRPLSPLTQGSAEDRLHETDDVLGELRGGSAKERGRAHSLSGYRSLSGSLGRREGGSSWTSSPATAFGRLSSAFNKSARDKDRDGGRDRDRFDDGHQQSLSTQQQQQGCIPPGSAFGGPGQSQTLSRSEEKAQRAALKAAEKELRAAEKAAAKAERRERKELRDKEREKDKERGRKSKSPGAALSDGETTPTSFFSRERLGLGMGLRSPPARPAADYTVSLPPLGTAAASAAQHRSIFSINWNQGGGQNPATLPPRSPGRSGAPNSASPSGGASGSSGSTGGGAAGYLTRGLGRFQLKRRNTANLPQQTNPHSSTTPMNNPSAPPLPPPPPNSQNYGSLIRRHSVDPDRRRSGGVHGGTEGHHVLHTALIHRIHSHNSEQSGGGHYASLPGSTCHQLQHPAGATAQALGLASSESSICDRIDIEDLGADETMLFVKFFRYYHCYDLIPLSAKLVVFDTQLLVKKAFFALVSNGVRAAPLWDSAQQDFVGMLTITDFIHILRKYHGSPTVRMDELEEHKIDTWRTVLTEMQRPLVSIGPDASLCDAITALIQQRVHRLPVIDPQTGNVLYVLTHKRILRFLFLYFYDLPHASYLDQSIQELKVGSFENIATCNPTTPLIDALKTFIERRVSALPVVDEDGKVVDIYAKFDVINLAAEKTYNNLDISVGATLEFRNQYFEGVMTCRATDSLLQVMGKIVRAEVHRLVIVDDEEHVVGIVSLSDILTFLVLKPLDIERPASRSYGIYARTTSSERENGTLAEEPELEATANAHGEGAVQTERLKHSNGSMCTVTDPDQAKEGQNAPKATEESMENEEKISVAQEGSIIESQQPEGPNSPQECFEHPAEQDELSNMSAEKLDDSEKASEKEELPQKLLSAKSALAPVAGVSTATSTQPENRADIITPVDTKS
ncbi:uncharacterized protein LOC111243559 isoform X2 [Varroa destructor]|uniref:CBS domain-containing protein n=1 Tax=Varroa destructor TaxID=109461 RepID=A0A7M7J253_VARDE|nr:uncharacterized protein LOC111243559 isoform X2 [Varroa destructor]